MHSDEGFKIILFVILSFICTVRHCIVTIYIKDKLRPIQSNISQYQEFIFSSLNISHLCSSWAGKAIFLWLSLIDENILEGQKIDNQLYKSSRTK